MCSSPPQQEGTRLSLTSCNRVRADMRIAAAVLIDADRGAAPLLALAQTAPAGKPDRPAAADPKKKSTPAPAGRDLGGGIAPAERVAIQLDLAWTGEYNGLINGEFNDRTIAAIKGVPEGQSAERDRHARAAGACPAGRALEAPAGRGSAGAWWTTRRPARRSGCRPCRCPTAHRARPARAGRPGKGRSRSRRSGSGSPARRWPTCSTNRRRSRRDAISRSNLLRDDFFIPSGHAGAQEILRPRRHQGRRGARHDARL